MKARWAVGIVVLLTAIAVLNLFVNALTFGGDPEIHLVFAKNAIEGFPLQFNRGLYSSGETSPGYMLVVAGFTAVVGTGGAAILMKLFGVLSAIALIVLLYREVKAAGWSEVMAATIAVAIAAAPAFFFQAQLGMENMPFAVGVALLLREILKKEQTIQAFVITVFIAHLLFFWRPEAVFMVALCYICNVAVAVRGRSPSRLIALAAMSLALAVSIALIERETGVPLQGAGKIRALTSQLIAPHILGLPAFVSIKPLAFVVYAWPLLVMIALGRKAITLDLCAALLSLVVLPWVLHLLSVFPNSHFSRYVLYLWFPTALIAVRCSNTLTLNARRSLTMLFAINTALVASAEITTRIRQGNYANQQLLATLSEHSVEAVRAFSDELCQKVGCANTPVVVAAQEVQVRLRLDRRFVVRSLDGIVDSELIKFVSHGTVDHLRYLEERRVAVLFDWPTYGHPTPESLSTVYSRTSHGPVEIRCARFERLEFRGHPLMTRRPTACASDFVNLATPAPPGG